MRISFGSFSIHFFYKESHIDRTEQAIEAHCRVMEMFGEMIKRKSCDTRSFSELHKKYSVLDL